MTGNALTKPLAQQVALVTGATRGIGRAIALRLAREGTSVCITGRNRKRGAGVVHEIAQAGGRAHYLPLDVVDYDATRRAVDDTIAMFGALDIAIANAGMGTIGRVADSDPADWRAMMDVNFHGTANLARAALEPMLAQRFGTILAVGSVAGIRGWPEWAGYCASKHAVVGFMECLGQEMTRRNIRVAMVSPGSVDTPFWDDLNQDVARVGSDAREVMMSADDIAELVVQQLKLPQTVVVKNAVAFPTSEWH